jgi:hypothetical protein
MKFLNKKGSALVMIMIFGALFAALGATLFVRYDTQKRALTQIDAHAKADWVAKGLSQLVLFKLKQLPSSFYKTDAYHKSLLAGTVVSGGDVFIKAWYEDFCDLQGFNVPLQHTGLQGIADVYLKSLPDATQNTYQAWIRGCSLIRKSVGGYERDFMRIKIDVSINGTMRKFEELVQIDRYSI